METTYYTTAKAVVKIDENGVVIWRHSGESIQALIDQIAALERQIVDLERRCMSEEFLSNGKQEIFEIFERTREEYDGSQYLQGKKDGLRIALACLGDVGFMDTVRGGPLANPENKEE